jgi:uncharacterized membrane protein
MKYYQLQRNMAVRFVQANNTGLAWYMIFTTTKPTQAVADYTTLKFRMSLILVHLIHLNGLMT